MNKPRPLAVYQFSWSQPLDTDSEYKKYAMLTAKESLAKQLPDDMFEIQQVELNSSWSSSQKYIATLKIMSIDLFEKTCDKYEAGIDRLLAINDNLEQRIEELETRLHISH